MAAIRTFRELIAWQKGMDLARLVYRATERMPAAERFGLTNQMRLNEEGRILQGLIKSLEAKARESPCS